MDCSNLVTFIPFPIDQIGNGKIYRSEFPFRYALEDFKTKLAIDTIVQLLDRHTLGDKKLSDYKERHFNVIYYPISDYQPPESYTETMNLIDTIILKTKEDKNVLIHCQSGRGRTGLILACIARKVFGHSGEQAVSWVRTFIPEAVETIDQHEFIADFLENVQEAKLHPEKDSFLTHRDRISHDYESNFDEQNEEISDEDLTLENMHRELDILELDLMLDFMEELTLTQASPISEAEGREENRI